MDEQKPFPYLQILSVVLMSVVVTVILFWVWHMVEMNTLKSAHAKQNDSVRAEIATLEAHVATLGTSTTVKK
jgi:cell division protein FtsB